MGSLKSVICLFVCKVPCLKAHVSSEFLNLCYLKILHHLQFQLTVIIKYVNEILEYKSKVFMFYIGAANSNNQICK